MSSPPSLRIERELMRGGVQRLAAIDEVGRGAIAGPVSVGVVLVHAGVKAAPAGVRDSKLLSAAARERLVPRLRRWAPAWAVGHASAGEIDDVGIMGALRLAGERALSQLPEQPDHVLLDGSYDWLTRPQPTLFDVEGAYEEVATVPVTTRVKADMTCSAVAAASVLAKTTRDAMMVALAKAHPGFAWDINKGYASPEHRDALLSMGPCVEHRRSWNIAGGAFASDSQGVSA